MLGRFDEARNDYREILRQKPGHPLASQALENLPRAGARGFAPGQRAPEPAREAPPTPATEGF